MSDTDEHELVIEEETALKRPVQAVRSKMSHPVQPTSSSAAEERKRQQKIADEQLLADAGISASDLNNEDERQQILAALRQSLPEAPSTSSRSAGVAAEDIQLMDDSNSRQTEFLNLVEPTLNVDDRTASSNPEPVHSVAEEESAAGGANIGGQPQEALLQGGTQRKRLQRSKEQASEGEIESTSDTSTSSKTGPRSKAQLTRVTKTGIRKLETAGDSDHTGKPHPKGTQKSVPSSTEASSDSDQCSKPLQNRVLKKFTAEQKTKMGEAFHSMYQKILSQSSSQSEHPPAAKENREEGVVGSSQDLFTVREGEEERSETNSLPASQSTPSGPLTSAAHGSEGIESGSLDMEVDEVETVPPHGSAFTPDSQEGEEEDACIEDDEGSQSSQESLIQLQAPQSRIIPIVVEDSVKNVEPPPAAKHVQRPHHIEEEEEEDRRPPPYDNRFNWSHSQPPSALKRKYRKRKWPPEEDETYQYFFCPPNVNPASYSKVILQLFDLYFAHFTMMQSTLTHRIPWGKPVRAGLHHAGTLDQKHRNGQAVVTFDGDDDDDDDDFANVPSAKKPAVRESVQMKPGQRVGVEHTQGPNYTRKDISVVGTFDLKSKTSAASQTVREEETQPYDLDLEGELPDLPFSTGHKSVNTHPPDERTDMDVDDENVDARKGRSSSPMIGSSQSSDSRLDANGDLYPTQIPPGRKRKGDGGQPFTQLMEEEEMFVEQSHSQRSEGGADRSPDRQDGGEGRSRRTCRNVQGTADTTVTHPATASRKRKQEHESPEVNLLDTSDEEVMPQKKKREVQSSAGNLGRQVKIFVDTDSSKCITTKVTQHQPSGQVIEGSGSRQATVHPQLASRPAQGEESQSKYCHRYERREASRETGVRESSGSAKPQQDAGTSGATDDEDSVQFLSIMPTEEKMDQGEYHGATHSRAHTASATATKLKPSVTTEVEPRVECPLCGQAFPKSRIEQHASDCLIEEEEEDPKPPQSTGNPLFPRGQMSRRPLHEVKRERLKCPYCDDLLRGVEALQRHQEMCRQRETLRQHRLEKNLAAGAGLRSRTPPEKAGPSQGAYSQDKKWLGTYSIPETGDQQKRSRPAKQQPDQEDDVEEIEEVPSDDSDKDPDFAPAKDDFQQAREDGDSPVKFKRVSDMANSPIDLKNQFTGKRKTRQGKRK